MIGQTFGQLTVLSAAPDRFFTAKTLQGKQYQKRFRYWTCQCGCGTTTEVDEYKLKCRKTTSCGCSRLRPIKIGDRFGRLTVIGRESDRFYGKSHKRNEIYRVLCDCGKEETRIKKELSGSNTTQCFSCAISGAHNANYKHGATEGRRVGRRSEMPEYRTWKTMKRRCYNPKHNEYHRYGGRGRSEERRVGKECTG